MALSQAHLPASQRASTDQAANLARTLYGKVVVSKHSKEAASLDATSVTGSSSPWSSPVAAKNNKGKKEVSAGKVCRIHGAGRHSTEECRMLTGFSNNGSSGKVSKHTSASSSSSGVVPSAGSAGLGGLSWPSSDATLASESSSASGSAPVTPASEPIPSLPSSAPAPIPAAVASVAHTAPSPSSAPFSSLSLSMKPGRLLIRVPHFRQSLLRCGRFWILHNGITASHSFEVFEFNADAEVSIGSDLMPLIGIYLKGLASCWHRSSRPSLPEPEDLPVPNNSLAGTPEQHKQFLESIQPYIQENINIPPSAFCTLPESVVRIHTPEGKVVNRRQYPLADKLIPILQTQIDQWLADGIIKHAPPGNAWNNPMTFAPKKDPKTGLPTSYRPLTTEDTLSEMETSITSWLLELLQEKQSEELWRDICTALIQPESATYSEDLEALHEQITMANSHKMGHIDRPYYSAMARILTYCFEQGELPANLVQNPVNLLQVTNKERLDMIQYELSTLEHSKEGLHRLLFEKLLPEDWRIFLQIRTTTGGSTFRVMPPSLRECFETFTRVYQKTNAKPRRHGQPYQLTVGAKALTEAKKNEHANEILKQILSDPVWINLHTLPHDRNVFEIRQSQGYGVRWTTEGDGVWGFRGFLEPQMEDGHSSKWVH
ncbi:hypothetical protein BDB00DRAFT_878337 [Zychaea mexicana]|uniref:uncharacterized protein n=1 Tax=Zychaea mexicana TaxID=64656 RepID=UPI0022FDC799|nr:uncharacterized protein BDB00DRAFT_878337 [Zychaea mexicana]KAI9484919.1 hypothetical protein BDB00DRAFT_878337 [Zychaea mexicana]